MAAPAPERGRRLGRGLDFLLSTTDPAGAALEQMEVELGRVRSNPWQPRTDFDEAGLASLADSIRQHGVLQPIAVRRKGDGFELIAGERRVLAARRAGLERVPAVVHPLDDSQMLFAALIENVQRADLNPVERARAFKRLVDEQGKSHEEVAQLAGIGRSTVSNAIRLLELDEPSLTALKAGRISEGHARALLAVGDLSERQRLLSMIQDQQLNVRSTELDSRSTGSRDRSGRSRSSADARRLERLLGDSLQAKVRIVEQGTRGKIVVNYSSLKDFERVYARLAGAPPPTE